MLFSSLEITFEKLPGLARRPRDPEDGVEMKPGARFTRHLAATSGRRRSLRTPKVTFPIYNVTVKLMLWSNWTIAEYVATL